MTQHAVELRHVVVSAGERIMLDDIELTIAHGERVAIVGQNGAGKSTLLRLLTGSIQPSHGTIKVLGHPLHSPQSARDLRSLRAQTGQVFQGLHLVQRLTTLENVLIGGLASHRSWLSWARIFPKRDIARAEQALQSVGLIGKASLRADRLSGGERQKVAIARMLMQRPRLVLADEPTAALDPGASVDIAVLLAGMGGPHKATLLTVVHDPGLLPLLAERVIGLRRGRLIFDLPVARVDDDCLGRLYRDGTATPGWIAQLVNGSPLQRSAGEAPNRERFA